MKLIFCQKQKIGKSFKQHIIALNVFFAPHNKEQIRQTYISKHNLELPN